jgi:hypothetical protein
MNGEQKSLYTEKITVGNYSLTFEISTRDFFVNISKYTFYNHFIQDNHRLACGVLQFIHALNMDLDVPVYTAAMYVNQLDTKTNLPDIITTFRIIEKYSIVEPKAKDQSILHCCYILSYPNGLLRILILI